jgi:hypothetical protein
MALNRAIGTDQGGGTNHSFHRFSLGVLFRPPRPVRFHRLDLWIGQKRKRQIKFLDELMVRLNAVSAHTQHYGIGLIYGLDSIAEPACFFGSAGGIVLGIKVKNDVFAGIVRQSMLLTVAALQGKDRSLLTFKTGHVAPPLCGMNAMYHTGGGSFNRRSRSRVKRC